MEIIGIVGYGEIGGAIAELYSDKKEYDVRIFDQAKNKNDDLTLSKFLNICIPYSDKFVEIVNEYVDKFSPNIVVIHSTVAPGTTIKIKGKVCHSPVRGQHPNLCQGLKTFLKYIGADNKEVAEEYQLHLNSLGINSYICKDSKTTEYAKLFDTTYYGVCIAFHAEVMSLCEKEGIDFHEVMTKYNTSYNEGYSKLGKNNVIRPVLFATKKIGGHCVVRNAEILAGISEENKDCELIKSILKYK